MKPETRTIVITGASGGLGSVVSRALADQGANLALLDRNVNNLSELSKSLSIPKQRIITRTLDLLLPSEIESAAKDIVSKFVKIDILLHLVGGWTGGKSLIEAPADDLSFMINQHIWTSFNVIKTFVPYLLKNSWGRVIMVTSPFAARPNAKGGPYAIGKSGQEAMMRTLSQELKGTGITANMLQVKTIDVKNEKVSAPSPNNASWTTPEELATAILYLISDQTDMINGAIIPLHGSY